MIIHMSYPVLQSIVAIQPPMSNTDELLLSTPPVVDMLTFSGSPLLPDNNKHMQVDQHDLFACMRQQT